jgi:hypothetical protein
MKNKFELFEIVKFSYALRNEALNITIPITGIGCIIVVYETSTGYEYKVDGIDFIFKESNLEVYDDIKSKYEKLIDELIKCTEYVEDDYATKSLMVLSWALTNQTYMISETSHRIEKKFVYDIIHRLEEVIPSLKAISIETL